MSTEDSHQILAVQRPAARSQRMAFCLLGAFVLAGLAPYSVSRLPLVLNQAKFTGEGTAQFSGAGFMFTLGSPPWLPHASRADSFNIHLVARAAITSTAAPEVILSLGPVDSNPQLEFVQSQSDLVVTLKTTDGLLRTFCLPGVFAESGWQDLKLSMKSGTIRLRHGEKREIVERMSDRPQSLWDDRCVLVLGNSSRRTSPWLGEIRRLDFTTEDSEYDVLKETWQVPRWYVAGSKFRNFSPSSYSLRESRLMWDALLNFAGFLPIGFLLARGTLGRPLWKYVLWCSLISLGVESAQMFVDSRFPSLMDWLMNSAGAVGGILVAECFRNRSAWRLHDQRRRQLGAWFEDAPPGRNARGSHPCRSTAAKG